MSRPLWKLKQFVSQKRNFEYLIWPESTNTEGQRFPPNPCLSENRKKNGEWTQTTVYLTTTQIPIMIANLQLLYQAMLAIENRIDGQAPSVSASMGHTQENPIAGKLYQFIREKQEPVDFNTLLMEFKVNADTLENALKALEDERMIKTERKGFTVFVEVA